MDTNNTIVKEANKVSGYAEMAPAQQNYLQTRQLTKGLYEAREILRDLQTMALNPERTPEDDLDIVRKVGLATTTVQDAAKLSYYQQVKIEEQHPQFKEEAQAYAKQMKEQRQQAANTMQAAM